MGGVRQILEGGDWRLGRKKLCTDIFRAWELSKQGHSGARSLCLHPNSERPVGNGEKGGEKGLGQRAAGRVQRTPGKKKPAGAEGSAAPSHPTPPHPFRLLPRFISQADVMATQQLCGMNSGARLLAGPPPAPVP